MKQYRITSGNFVHQGESGYDDAVMDSADLRELKRLAGLPISEDGGALSGIMATPRASEEGIVSPVGSTAGYSAGERNSLIKEYCADPGSPLWMMIMFSHQNTSPKSLSERVEEYLTKHPDERVKPRPLPGQ